MNMTTLFKLKTAMIRSEKIYIAVNKIDPAWWYKVSLESE